MAALKTLLDTLMLKGCIVTIDAIGCQTDIAHKILDRGGDYLLEVKNNQDNLTDASREFCDDGARSFGKLPVSHWKTVEKDRGRIETRRAAWVNELSWLYRPIRENWPKLAGVRIIERQRDIGGKVSVEHAFYIGSKAVTTAEGFAQAARCHWEIGNSLDRTLDVTFRGDDCRVRKGHSPQNLSALRKFALTLQAVAIPPAEIRTIGRRCLVWGLWGNCDYPVENLIDCMKPGHAFSHCLGAP